MSQRVPVKDSILDAAERVVGEAGAAHLTLDAVAHAADVSKGGLLYHYPTKEALLQGMLARLLERFDDAKSHYLSAEPPGPGADLRAHIRTSFAFMQQYKRVSAAILAAGANDPKLLDPLREQVSCDLRALQGSSRQVARALIVVLATDGLWFNELLETLPLGPAERQAVLEELLILAEPVGGREEEA